MATGDSNDFRDRLRSLITAGWFVQRAPLLRVVLGGLSDALAWIFALLMAAKAQTRIASAGGWILDLVAWDFFGDRFLRRLGENDPSWRARIIAELFRERVTRKGITEALVNLTGRAPVIVELFNPTDCGGGYGVGAIAYGGSSVSAPVSGYGLGGGSLGGYGTGSFAYGYVPTETRTSAGAGIYGSLSYPCQVFVQAFRDAPAGIPNLDGYGGYAGGYGVGSIAYADIDSVTGAVTDDDIYEAVAETVASGVTAWVAISD